VLQLTIAWVFIGYTHGVESQYWLMLMLPVLSAASYLGMAGTLATSIAAVGLYLSFLRFVDFREFFISPEEKHFLAIRCLMLAVAAVLVNTLAAAKQGGETRVCWPPKRPAAIGAPGRPGPVGPRAWR